MRKRNTKKRTAIKVKECVKSLGNAIEDANELGLTVKLEVWFNDGGESIQLHRLSGEIDVLVGYFEEL